MSRAALVLTLALAGLARAETTQKAFRVETARGVELRVIAHYPGEAHPDTLPALVIAPGQGYHMGLPVITNLAKQAARMGVVAFRFDWGYHGVEGGAPSPDLALEAEDMTTVINLALGDDRVDAGRVMLAGKSLGSLVAYRLFREYTKLRACFLLTPVVRGELAAADAALARSYPELIRVERPVVCVLGDRDPLCALPVLYAALGPSQGTVKVAVVAGDHSLNVGDYRDPAFTGRNEANHQAAARLVVHWIRVLLERDLDAQRE